MMNWFCAGGFGMILLLAIGAGAIGYGVKAVREPTAERVAALRSLPALLVTTALFSFGTNLWAINVHLSNAAVLKALDAAQGERSLDALIGVTEAGQVFTLGGILAVAVLVLRMVADARHASATRA